MPVAPNNENQSQSPGRLRLSANAATQSNAPTCLSPSIKNATKQKQKPKNSKLIRGNLSVFFVFA